MLMIIMLNVCVLFCLFVRMCANSFVSLVTAVQLTQSMNEHKFSDCSRRTDQCVMTTQPICQYVTECGLATAHRTTDQQ